MTAEKALLVQVLFPGRGRFDPAESLEELALLADSSGAEVVGTVTQELARPSSATLVGSGKLEFLVETVEGLSADLVVFDNELSPVQNRNIEQALKVKVLDRTGLILDIFALRAQTKEAVLQVELAQLEYLMPRLTGMWTFLSRQAGGIGTRGPGETQLELDRRRIQARLTQLKRRLAKVRRTRELHRAGRRDSGVPVVALVGYTNAGKSTLLNRLSGSEIYTADRLFATLDPTHRRIALPSEHAATVVDTVGFIQNLPHQLVEAFRSTLEEVATADLLLHVVDAGHPFAEEQERAVRKVLDEIGAGERPVIRVLNKIDRLDSADPAFADGGSCALDRADGVCVSARVGTGLDELLARIDSRLFPDRVKATYRIPAADGRALADLYRNGKIVRRTVMDDVIECDAELDARQAVRFRAFRVSA